MLSEAMLACAGVINRMGTIAAGSTVSDYHESEQHRQISVSTTLMHLDWLGKKFNILDCPGYADFISEAMGALRVSDLARGGGARQPRIGRRHGCGLEMRDREWHPQGDCRECVRQGRDGFREVAGADSRALRRSRVPADRAAQRRARGSTRCWTCRATRSSPMRPTRAGSSRKRRPPALWPSGSKQLHGQLIEYIAESDDALMEKFFAQGGLIGGGDARRACMRPSRSRCSCRCSARRQKPISASRG